MPQAAEYGASPGAGKGQPARALAVLPARPCPQRLAGGAPALPSRSRAGQTGSGCAPAEAARGALRSCLVIPGSGTCLPPHLSGQPQAAPGVSPQHPEDGEPGGAAFPSPAPWAQQVLEVRLEKEKNNRSTSLPDVVFERNHTAPSTQDSSLQEHDALACRGCLPHSAQEGFQTLTLGVGQARPHQSRVQSC